MKRRRHVPDEWGYLFLFAIALLFSGLTMLFNPPLALGEAVISLVLFSFLRTSLERRNRDMAEYMRNREDNLESATRGTIVNAPLPMVIFQPETEEIIWSNNRFLALAGHPEHLFDTKLSEAVPDFEYRWLTDGKWRAPEPVLVNEAWYLVYGNLIDGKMAICYWVDITPYAAAKEQYLDSRPVAAILLIDNYDDLMRGIDESERSVLLSELNKRISAWAEPMQGIFCRYDHEHYLLVFEASHLAEIQRQRFQVLESAREVRGSNEITATLSIGIAKNAPSLRLLFQNANMSMEMALSRGGDQVVLRDGEAYQFFGGKAKETERRSKLKSRVVANALQELLSGALRVVIVGHRHPDMDVIGAAAGLSAIARAKGLPAYIVREAERCPAEEMIEKLLQMPAYEDAFLLPEEALDLVDEQTLLIVVDTNRPEQVQVPSLLERAGRVVVMDHHRRAATYIENPTLSFEDPYASSASELAVELMQHLLSPGELSRQEAEATLAGIVLDTKNFTLRTGGRTFESAAYLRRAGADTDTVRRFFQSDWESAMARYAIVQHTKLYREGISIAVSNQTADRVTAAKAADEMITIADIAAAFVLSPMDGHTLMLSARSVGVVNVQLIVERLGGGGNAAAAGAQLQGMTLPEAEQALKAAIDAYLDE